MLSQSEPVEILRLELADEAATGALARALAALVRPGDVIALCGDLGLGKTTFARFFIRAQLGEDTEVPSPTFNLVQTYETNVGTIWHFDLYRLESPDEAFELGIEEAFADGISLIEWPDRLGDLLPTERLEIRLETGDAEDARRVVIRGGGDWPGRAGALKAGHD
jgi:tRNA threonylcarbamoyladenosine biosynthesis protein TsaE